MEPVPEGVRGQLYIGGEGVARGYVRRPELTAERFVADPFAQPSEQRMYCTGDVARWLPDGRLECIGRSDHQLKVRGFRIEPGEIEAVLLETAAVSQAVVVSRTFGPGDVRLVAYVVPGTGQEPMPSELRALLRKRLPEYMIPSIFTFLERLPLNQSGKVDRRALPDPTGFQTRASAGRPPETEAEKFVAEVWREVLGVQEIHAEDNFFDLGGHSLLAMRVTVKAQKRFGRHVNPIKLAFLNLSQFAVECTAVAVDTGAPVSHHNA
jgi:acyl carrier protein